MQRVGSFACRRAQGTYGIEKGHTRCVSSFGMASGHARLLLDVTCVLLEGRMAGTATKLSLLHEGLSAKTFT